MLPLNLVAQLADLVPRWVFIFCWASPAVAALILIIIHRCSIGKMIAIGLYYLILFVVLSTSIRSVEQAQRYFGMTGSGPILAMFLVIKSLLVHATPPGEQRGFPVKTKDDGNPWP